jgi:hypothetical protein
MAVLGTVANLFLNILIIVLLSLTIGYCWLLNRRIKILQDSRSELAMLLKHFDESTQRASESIIALQTASRKIGDNIQFRIEKANYLIDDLSFMIEKGNKLASQMEAGFAVNRARERVNAEQQPIPQAQPEPRLQERAFVEARPAAPPPAREQREKLPASLESVIDKVIGRSRSEENGFERLADARPQQPAPSQGRRSRSRSEQELLDLIKAGIKG